MRRSPTTHVRIRIRRATAGLALAALLGGAALPLLDAALAAETAPLCCSKGRCCCTGETAEADERPCLRRGCGCERPDASVAFGRLRLEAVLPTGLPAQLEPRTPGAAKALAIVLSRPYAPPVPPPRRALPA
jgi:hypothetical protein